MNKEEKESKVLKITTRLETTMPLIDMIAEELENDIDLLEEAKQSLKNKISFNESANALITALGGNYDSEEDKFKIKSLDAIVNLIKTRIEYKKSVIERENKKFNQNMLLNKLFGLGESDE